MFNRNSLITEKHEIPANTEKRRMVGRADLPLHCPMDGMSLWNSHPRVYLPIEATGQTLCPYCGTEYKLRKAS